MRITNPQDADGIALLKKVYVASGTVLEGEGTEQIPLSVSISSVTVSIFPSFSGNAGKFLSVDSSENGLEWSVIDYSVVDSKIESAISSSIDLSGYATQDYVDSKISSIFLNPIDPEVVSGYVYSSVIEVVSSIDLSDYATKDYVESSVSEIINSGYMETIVSAVNSSIDLSGYAKESYVDDKIDLIRSSIPSMSDYATTDYVDSAISSVSSVDLSGYATKDYVDSAIDLSNYATADYVEDRIDSISSSQISSDVVYVYVNSAVAEAVSSIDMSDFATTSYVDEKIVSSISSIDLSGYAKKDDISAYVSEVISSSMYIESIVSTVSCSIDLSGYAATSYVDEKIVSSISSIDLSAYATKAYVDSALEVVSSMDLSDYATKDYVTSAVSGIVISEYTETIVSSVYSSMDMSGYATTDYVTSAISSVTSSADYSNVVLVGSEEERNGVLINCMENKGKMTIFTPSSNDWWIGDSINWKFGHLYAAFCIDFADLYNSFIDWLYPRNFIITAVRKYYVFTGKSCTSKGVSYDLSNMYEGDRSIGYIQKYVTAGSYNGTPWWRLMEIVEFGDENEEAYEALSGKTMRMSDGRILEVNSYEDPNSSTGYSWYGTICERKSNGSLVPMDRADSLEVTWKASWYGIAGYYSNKPDNVEELPVVFVRDITHGVLCQKPVDLVSSSVIVKPGEMYSLNLLEDTVIGAKGGEEGKWSMADIDINPGTYNLTAGSNMILVDSLTPSKLNHCEIRWRGINARLKVIDVEE